MHRLAFCVLLLGSIAHAQLPADPRPVPQASPADPQPAPQASPDDPQSAPVVTEPPASVAKPRIVVDEWPTPRFSVHLDGYIQPQFRLRQDSSAQDDTNGFRFARVRPIIRARTELTTDLAVNAFFEVEVQPAFQLVDGFVGVTRTFDKEGELVVDAGQMRVPISRQQLLSDSRLSFVDKAQIATIAPRRDLGGRVTFVPPGVPMKVLAGVFNGEGPNQIENINQKFLYAGRAEVIVLGKEGPIAESNFGESFLTLAGSIGFNKLTNGDRIESVTYIGGDISGAYKGLSGSFEYLYVKHTLATTNAMTMLPPDFNQNGWSAQLAYLLPFELPPKWPYLKGYVGRLEVGARVEEIDRNDTIPIVKAGDPEQSVRIYTGVLTYYVRQHSVKVALALSHIDEIEDRTVAGEDAAYDNDQAMFQLTYRME